MTSLKGVKRKVKDTIEDMVGAVEAKRGTAREAGIPDSSPGPKSQPSVFSKGKKHALFLWINLKTETNMKEVGKQCAELQNMVNQVSPPNSRNESNAILAGVGFGPTAYRQLGGSPKENYNYNYRRGSKGEMPSSGGDVFVHAKSDNYSKLFELCELFLNRLPADSVESAEDIYGFVYKDERDLSGFIDGTENPKDEELRQKVAVEKETGGSYVVTQKWIHNLKMIKKTDVKEMEEWVGRTKDKSEELKKKPHSAHIARITGGNAFRQKKTYEIVRQSLPFGSVTGDAGLFFIAYSASPVNLNFMLDRMVGAESFGDRSSDDIMLFTRNVKGTFWYFPGVAELSEMAS